MIKLDELIKLTDKLSVLYVEDDDILRESVEIYLNKIFTNVTTASNGQNGLNYYKEK